jgi:outer membrane biosynthesis protein TonB
MNKGMAISLALHVAVLTVAVIGLPDFFHLKDETPQIIPVDVVQIAEQTTVKPPEKKPEEKPEPKPEPPKVQPKPPAPKPDAVPPPPDEISDLPKPRAKPEPPKPEPKLAELDVKPRPKPKPPKPPRQFDPSRIAALLDKSKKDEAAPSQPQPQTIDTARITASLQDAIRSQVQPCWLFPAGAPNAEDLVVRLHIALNPDGSLNGPPEILDQSKIGQSDYYRVAAESARRAVQKCAPLKLPVDSYDIWRDIDLTFDPKQMITG